MPNLDNIRKWRDALLSGRFEQGPFYLKYVTKEGPRHCCLGVACEIAKENGVSMEEVGTSRGKVFYDGESDTLPYAVKQWLGIKDGNPNLLYKHWGFLAATSLNDYHNLSFREIAGAITATFNLDKEQR